MKLRFLAAVGGLLLALAGVAAAADGTAKDGTAKERTWAAEEVRAEFDTLYRRLQESHYDLYARRTKAEYDAFHRTLRRGFDRPLTRAQIEARFQMFTAYGRVAHARIDSASDAYRAYREAGGKAFPLDIRTVGSVVRVASNGSGIEAIEIGDEIVTLNGKPIREWTRRAGAHESADNDYMRDTLLERRFGFGLWAELGAVDTFALTLRKADGKRLALTLPARSRADVEQATERAAKTLELSWDTREARMTGDGVAYLRPGPFYNNAPEATDMWDTSAFYTFVDGAFESFIAAGAKSVVIDLRDNPGGDNSFSDRMIAWFAHKPWRFFSDFRVKVSQAAIDTNAKRVVLEKDPQGIAHRFAAEYAQRKLGDVFSFDLPYAQPRDGRRFDGKVYLLINRHSYSNTANVAALVQDYRFGTVLGEETSDLATTYGAMEQFDLPQTGIIVGFPKAYIVRPSGDKAARGVVPDVAIETPLPEPADDPVLRKALTIAAAKR